MIQYPKKRLTLIFSVFIITVLSLMTYGLKGYLMPIFLAIVLVYLTRPIYLYLKSLGLGETLSASLISLSLFGIIILFILKGIPLLATEFSRFIQNLPSSIESTYQIINNHLAAYNIQFQIPNWQAIINRIIDTQDISSLNALPKLLTNTIQHSIDIILFFTSLLFIPLFYFFALKDGENAVHRFVDWAPANIREDVNWFMTQLHDTLTTWIAGQGTLIITLCIIYSTGLSIIECPYSITLGIITGFLYIIPVAGAVLAYTICTITMVTSFGPSIFIFSQITLLFSLTHLFEGMILSPYLIGNRLGLNLPSALLVIMIGGGLFGAVGIIFAVPTASLIIKTMGSIFHQDDSSWLVDQT
ncbi:AI-2E family transporter [Gammaproteobacteria bacterium]|nr:AI-2E family transporter [Gammaproteobacteria bacterium]